MSDELEQLRADYNILKSKLEQQEIINDDLLRATMKSRVGSLKHMTVLEYFSAILVIVASPFAFHANPAINASWWFVGFTCVMMVFCLVMTIKYNKKVSRTNTTDVNLREFCENVKELRNRWTNWRKIAIPMIVVWASWLIAETILNSSDIKRALGAIIAMIIGGTIGGIIGNHQRRRIIKYCDELIAQIDN